MNKVKNIDVQAIDKHGKIYDADGNKMLMSHIVRQPVFGIYDQV